MGSIGRDLAAGERTEAAWRRAEGWAAPVFLVAMVIVFLAALAWFGVQASAGVGLQDRLAAVPTATVESHGTAGYERVLFGERRAAPLPATAFRVELDGTSYRFRIYDSLLPEGARDAFPGEVVDNPLAASPRPRTVWPEVPYYPLDD